jgi:hypothetical protein
MTSVLDASIVPITLTVNGKIGLTLWAPPWEDDEGEEWQGFLGDGAKILMYPSPQELFEFIASGDENDLSDHPAWPSVLKLTPAQLRPSAEDAYDLDEVYSWAAGEPDPIHVSSLANVVDMVVKIADCCDDGALRRLVGSTPAYEELVDEDVSYQGKDGRRRWTELGDVIAESWERAIGRVESWLSWQGDFTNNDLDAETIWDRVGAEPIEIVLDDVTYFTVRGYGARTGEDTASTQAAGTGIRSDDDVVLFLGSDGNVAVFTEVADLATFCRTATEHELVHLEWWSELADVEDDEVFRPEEDLRYDLTAPSTDAAELLEELIDFCNLDADAESLGDPEDAESIDPATWTALVTEVQTCFQPQD